MGKSSWDTIARFGLEALEGVTNTRRRFVKKYQVARKQTWVNAILWVFTARNTPPLVIQPFTYDALPRSLRKKYM